MGVNLVMELSPGEVSQQEWVCISSLVSWSGLGVCDSPQCPGSRVRRGLHCRGMRRQLVGFLRWVNWRVSPAWKSQREPGEKQTLGGDTWDRQGAVLLAAHQEEAWGDTGVSCLSLPLLAPPQAAILQQTAEYIFSLEQEKTRLLQQNTQLKRFIQVLPQGWDSRGGTILADQAGDVIAVPWAQGGTLYPAQPQSGGVSIPLAGQGAPFNLASLPWQGEKGRGPVFQYFHPFEVSGMAWWQSWCWGALVELPWVSQSENQIGTRLWG